MTEYRSTKRVKATRWWRHGDHPEVDPWCLPTDKDAESACTQCWRPAHEHGHVREAPRYGWTLCPGDWVVDDGLGLNTHPDTYFREHYEPEGGWDE